ncbi:lysosomal acid lipase-related [Holotrichia oblita]|uniref:Lysosomal acid lipase-related n=1 Tax=Holotrichia oblita TaxID=644536 RepID=A0ACB9SH39_HOLOL|nr:lysosomal acid lipase-related [Holotrichia oblita]
MIQRHGYEVEEHVDVQTSDGYLLDLHRIPYGKDNSDETKKPVVFLMHGLLSSSADWVNMGAEKSLAYQLADAGYDVWMGNARGNKWSRKHISYNPDSNSAFWDFSWHEIGAIDLPTMIDYVLETTGQEQLFYIGHSQGTTSFWVMGAERPEYNDKIKLMVALAPIAYMSNLTNPFFQLASVFHNTLEWVLSFLGVDEFLPSTGLMELIGQASCNDESMFQGVCASIYFLIGGWNSAQLNATMIPVILTNAPAGAATKQLLHYAQGINSGTHSLNSHVLMLINYFFAFLGHFRRYDHGWISNLIQYGSISPPSYDTSAIRAPVALLYSANDWLAAIIDVKQLESELPNVVTSYLVSDSKFNHLDFVFAIDIRELLYDRVLTLLEKYQ